MPMTKGRQMYLLSPYALNIRSVTCRGPGRRTHAWILHVHTMRIV
jgi:hypothetical protein